jgi:hypothetical protein
LLTSDLVRFRKKGDKVEPRWLDARAKQRLSTVAARIIDVYRAHVGRTRAELDDALRAVDVTARDRVAVLGLQKLCDDRATLERPAGLDPERVRGEVFLLSARAHREATTRPFDRAGVLARAADALDASPEDLERALFADLRDAQVVAHFEPLGPRELLERYDLALAQAALLRATRVVVDLVDDDAARVRNVFRAAKFHGLLHTIEQRSGAYRIALDGPFSLFEAVQKYGLRLGMFLPSVLALRRFDLRADVLVGPGRAPAELVLSDALGLVAPREPPTGMRAEVEELARAFEALGSEWDVSPSDRILPAGGQDVIVPDLVFVSRETGEETFFEMFGFWSRDAVWRRIEQVHAGLPARLVLGVSTKLRVSREALDEGSGSSLLVFKTTPSAKELLARLRGPGGRASPAVAGAGTLS